MNTHKAALIILDGWGLGDGSSSDAIAQANTPFFDHLMRTVPNSTLKTFGMHVGLPDGQMGNSEVGHMNIGAGRVVYQDLTRINKAISDGELAKNQAIRKVISYALNENKPVHLLGLLSHGGVHSSQDHLHALIDILHDGGVKNTFVHAFTDGRDTEPRNAATCLRELVSFTASKNAKLVSMVGRYFAMDRDQRWERIKVAYDLLIHGHGAPTTNFVEAANDFYTKDITDEFFEAMVIEGGEGRIKEGDAVIFFNFRTDRCREIVEALSQRDIVDHGMRKLNIHLTTMARYDERFEHVDVIFEKDNLENTLGEVLSKQGCTQLRMAETEKYPHVTFFFSGGREMPFVGEQRIVVSSPKVATYDLQPEMSAAELNEKAVQAVKDSTPDFLCLNFANPDMVGHTGVRRAIVRAVETVDHCLSSLVQTLRGLGYQIVIIADHGNADITTQPDGTPHTAHTMNPVPCIILSDTIYEVRDGILGDVAPTILQLMGLNVPPEMTGNSLLMA